MFPRTVERRDIPAQEDIDLGATLCPPHEFDSGWASPAVPSSSDDTVPALYCRSCGEVRAFRIPTDPSAA